MTHVGTANRFLAIRSLEQWLEGQLAELGAVSATLFLPDPNWRGQFKLALMVGLTVPESMYGFVFPRAAFERRGFTTGLDHATFFRDAPNDPRLHGDRDPVLAELTITNRLFGDFVDREQVASSARFRRVDQRGHITAVFWVNFSARNDFDAVTRQNLAALFDRIVELIPTIRAVADAEDRFSLNALAQILDATAFLAETGKHLEEYLGAILDATLSALGIDYQNGDGIGSVFRYEAANKLLRRVAVRGSPIESAQIVNDVTKGEGVISWVALRKRALMIRDLEHSQFRHTGVYIEVARGIRSELAVPMLAGDQLIGVLNIESALRESPFTPSAVRAVSYAATQASIAYRVADERDRSDRFFAILQRAIDSSAATEDGSIDVGAPQRAMDNLAQLVAESLEAQRACIFIYGTDGDTVPTGVGTNYVRRTTPEMPRTTDGFTAWIRRTKMPVWLSDIRSDERFRCHVWVDSRWLASLPGGPLALPVTLNTGGRASSFGSQLGYPVVVAGRCIGVTWLKFQETTSLPSAPRMGNAAAITAGIALTVLRYQQELARQQGRRSIAVSVQERLFPTRSFSARNLAGHVISRPCGAQIGGDFYAISQAGADQTVFLIGDAEFHGLDAVFGMLPIIANFNLVSRESQSTKHILQRISLPSDQLGIPASAMCFILDGRKRANRAGMFDLFVSDAGHPPLIIIRESGQTIHVPAVDRVANRGLFGVGLDVPLGEENYELSEGDHVIAFTDGISEAGQGDDRLLGYLGIAGIALDAIRESASVQQVAEAIENAAIARSRGHQRDDLTVLVLRVGQ